MDYGHGLLESEPSLDSLQVVVFDLVWFPRAPIVVLFDGLVRFDAIVLLKVEFFKLESVVEVRALAIC